MTNSTLNILYQIASNPKQAIALETIAKGTMRPAFTLMNKDGDKEAKEYSASLEAIYQLICLVLHLMVSDKGKELGFIAGKKIFKNIENNGFAQYQSFQKVLDAVNHKQVVPSLVKGSYILGSIIASVISRAIIAPPLNHMILKPIMKLIGLKPPGELNKEPILESLALSQGRKEGSKMSFMKHA